MSFSLEAQSQQFSGWAAVFNTCKLNKNLSLSFDAQLRSSDKWVHPQTLLLRPGINFNLSKQTIISAGYALVHNRTVKTNSSGYFSEHRLWQQLILLQPVSKTSIQHRFRFEERFIPQTSVVNDALQKENTLLATRLRYFARTMIPFSNSTTFKKGWFGAVQNEVFANITNQAATNNNFFDQNRAYAAIGYRLHKSADIEIGYMNHHINGSTITVNNHVIQFAAYLRP